MNILLTQIKTDLKIAMKMEVTLKKEGKQNSEEYIDAVEHKTFCRAIISMIPETGKKPEDATEDDIIKLIKKYINGEKERQLYIDKHLGKADVSNITSKELKILVNKKFQDLGDKLTNNLIIIAKTYLPQQVSEKEVIHWINNNIDLTQYKNKMQAMGPIMKQFKGADGNFIKNILMKL